MNKSKAKKIAAIIGVAAILSLYLISLFIGIFFSDKYPGLFMASVFSAVVIPIMIYAFVAVYRYVHKRTGSGKETEEDTDNADK